MLIAVKSLRSSFVDVCPLLHSPVLILGVWCKQYIIMVISLGTSFPCVLGAFPVMKQIQCLCLEMMHCENVVCTKYHFSYFNAWHMHKKIQCYLVMHRVERWTAVCTLIHFHFWETSIVPYASFISCIVLVFHRYQHPQSEPLCITHSDYLLSEAPQWTKTQKA